MQRRNLTDKFIESVKPTPGRRQEFADALLPGFRFRVSGSGVKSFSIVYRLHGVQQRFTVGKTAVYSLAQARETAREARRLADAGIDPRERRKAGSDTFEAAWGRYLEESVKPRLRAARQVERTGVNHILPSLGKMKLNSITRKHVVTMLEKIQKDTPTQAVMVRAFCRAFFNWAEAKDMISSNPAKLAKIDAQIVERDKELEEGELIKVLLAARSGGLFGKAVELMILTACRRNEALKLEWSEVDFEAALWRLPAARAKNKTAAIIALSPRAIELLRSVEKTDDKYVFSQTPGHAYSSPVHGKEDIDRASGVTGWHLHDIRRTVAGGLQDLGTPDEIIQRILNHSRKSRVGKASGVYMRRDKMPEKRQALEKWAEHLEMLVRPRVTA